MASPRFMDKIFGDLSKDDLLKITVMVGPSNDGIITGVVSEVDFPNSCLTMNTSGATIFISFSSIDLVRIENKGT